MSRNQKAPLLAFVLVALVCCLVLVDSMRGDASDGPESASSSSSASSAGAGDHDPTEPASADDVAPTGDAPFELSPQFGVGFVGSVGPGRGSVVADDSPLGSAPADPPAGTPGELEPAAGGAAGPDQESDAAAPSYPGDTEEAGEEGEASPRKAKRRDKGKGLSEHLPDELPGIGPDSGSADPEQPGGNGQPGNDQPGVGSSSVGPSPAISQVPDLGSLLTFPDLTPRSGAAEGTAP